MTRQSPPLVSVANLREGQFNNATCEQTMERMTSGSSDNAIGATGVGHATPIGLQAGEVIGYITFITGGTAAGTPTAGYVALYGPGATLSSAPVLVAQSADLGSTARAANTKYTIAMTTAYTVPTAGLFFVSISFTAGTVPTLRGGTNGNLVMGTALITGMPVLTQSHGSALGATPPATITGGTGVTTPCYYLLSTNS